MNRPGRDDLARALRELVAASGLQPAEVARRTGLSEATVSRYLNAKTPATPAGVRKIVDALGAAGSEVSDQALQLAEDLRSGAASRVVVLRSGSATSQRRFAEIEAAAKHIATFTCSMVPGLLQTEAYARTVFAAGGQSGDALETNLRDRLNLRQQRLDDPGYHFTQVMTEGALRWQVGSPDLMAGQLEHIATLAGKDSDGRVRIGVIPSSAVVDLFPRTNFDLYDEDRAVIVGTDFGTSFLDRPHDVAVYVEQFRRLTELAVFGEQARALLTGIGKGYRREV